MHSHLLPQKIRCDLPRGYMLTPEKMPQVSSYRPPLSPDFDYPAGARRRHGIGKSRPDQTSQTQTFGLVA